MSIQPLRQLVAMMTISLCIRATLALLGILIWWGGGSPASRSELGALFLGMRWGMGIFGPALACYLTWKTVVIRSTQSATGILYIAMTLVLFGELCGMILGRDVGWEF